MYTDKNAPAASPPWDRAESTETVVSDDSEDPLTGLRDQNLRLLRQTRHVREARRPAARAPAHEMTRTVNGTGHTSPSRFCATSS